MRPHERGHNLADQIKLGKIYTNANEFPNSFRWFMEAAKRGDKFAESFIGVMYFERGFELGIINDEEKYTLALHSLEKSIKQGCATAQAYFDSIQKQRIAN
jgi:hypothetical protein